MPPARAPSIVRAGSSDSGHGADASPPHGLVAAVLASVEHAEVGEPSEPDACGYNGRSGPAGSEDRRSGRCS